MDQYDFLRNFRIHFFLKNIPFNSLKSVHVEKKGSDLGTMGTELSLGIAIVPNNV